MSSTRLISTMSFQAGRTIGVAGPRATACNCCSRSGTSLGACSVSNNSQSKPESDTTSAVMLLHRLHHRPICNCPCASACLKLLRGSSMSLALSNKLYSKPAQRTEIGVQRAAFVGPDRPGERAGQHDIARLEHGAERADFVGQPGDAERRMPEHTGRQARL